MENLPPQEAEQTLNEIARGIEREEHSKRIFVCIPNMGNLNVGLVAKLFHMAMQRKYDPWFHFLTEKRHADFARNQAVKAFLESKCDALLMIDHDVDPHPDILSMIDLDKDVIAGNVFCWINGELMASIWEKAECEQCRNLSIWLKDHKVHDASQYKESGGLLYRWNPLTNGWYQFATPEGMFPDIHCRCQDTGKDPFVFRTHQALSGNAQLVDSVGSAALMIQRRVFNQLPFPWFRFLYKESGEILLTEDHYFCWKVQTCGMEVWADPTKMCEHYKTIGLTQLTPMMMKAYEAGARSAKIKQSMEVPK